MAFICWYVAANTPVQHHIPTATPQVVPPYPMDARHPIPQAAMAPQPGFVPGGYQGAQYPPSGPYTPPVGPTPYPPQGGFTYSLMLMSK